MHVTDWVPTLLSLAGVDAPAGLDGVNVWPTLATDAPVRKEVVVNINPLCHGGQFDSPKAGYIQGDLKLLCFCYTVAGIDGANETACLVRDFPV